MNKLKLFYHNHTGHNININTGICADCGKFIGTQNAKASLFGRCDYLTLKEYKKGEN